MDPLKRQTSTATPAEPGGLFCLASATTRHRRRLRRPFGLMRTHSSIGSASGFGKLMSNCVA